MSTDHLVGYEHDILHKPFDLSTNCACVRADNVWSLCLCFRQFTTLLYVALYLGICFMYIWISLLIEGRSGNRIPVGSEIFSPRPDRLWVSPSLLHSGYHVSFLGVKRPGCGVDHPSHLAPRLRKSRAIPVLRLWAFMTCSTANCIYFLSVDILMGNRFIL
jgi:hypothetical protein